MIDERKILFVNFAVMNCGVHQYGVNLYSVLAHSQRYEFVYVDVLSLEDLDREADKGDWAAILINFHPQTLSFIRPEMPRRFRSVCVAVMHEMMQSEVDSMPRGLFQFYIMGDPTLRQTNPNVFSTGRIVLEYENKKPLAQLVTVGSFGFSVGSKGFQRLVDLVQEEFDEAVVRINIPANGIIDQNATEAKRQVDLCRERLWKPGIQIKATHEFFDKDQLIDFLASNTLNAFLYDYIVKAGISSAADHAMTARRPIAITKSIMFRHLHNLKPPITIEDTSLKEIIRNGTRPYDHLLQEWSPQRICSRYEEILSTVLSTNKIGAIPPERMTNSIAESAKFSLIREKMMISPLRVIRGLKRRASKYVLRPGAFGIKSAWLNILILLGLKKPRKHLNRILDDSARIEYAATIRKLSELVPQIVAKKIPRANIQQAFIFHTVEMFIRQFSKPRILCVGSFEDSAAVALKEIGFSIEEIDPVINKLDLNGFYNLPTTKPGSYDIIFSTSVLEHVNEDQQFMRQMADLLAPGGVGILTCDFKEGYKVGDPVIGGDYRFYTKQDLLQRILGELKDCELVGTPKWDCPYPDFELGGFKYTFATLVFRNSGNPDFRVTWDGLEPSEQAKFFDENGFLVIPAALSQKEVRRAIGEIKQFGLHGTTEDIWEAPFTRSLITNSKLLAALTAIFGKEIRFFKGAYVETPPSGGGDVRHQRKALHVDYGIGEPQGDLRNSAASWVNVAFYLTDLTPEHSPLWVVPGSNRIYSVVPASDLNRLEDRAKMVLARAGDAVLFHSNTVHAASHNFSNETRHTLFFSYRPAWAKPAGPVREWPDEFVQSFPSKHLGLFRELNVGL